MTPLSPDQWTVMLIKEQLSKKDSKGQERESRFRFHLAFLTLGPDGQMRICDLAEFMKLTGQEGFSNTMEEELAKLKQYQPFTMEKDKCWRPVRVVQCH
jgi:hypothetical protein